MLVSITGISIQNKSLLISTSSSRTDDFEILGNYLLLFSFRIWLSSGKDKFGSDQSRRVKLLYRTYQNPLLSLFATEWRDDVQ